MLPVSTEFDDITYSRGALFARCPDWRVCFADQASIAEMYAESPKWCEQTWCSFDFFCQPNWQSYNYECQKCNIVQIEYRQAMTGQFGFGVPVKSNAKVTYVNTSGEYSTYQPDFTLPLIGDCQPAKLNDKVLPNTPYKIEMGWNSQDNCFEERVNTFYGFTNTFPEITNQNGLNYTAEVNLVDYMTLLEGFILTRDILLTDTNFVEIITEVLNQANLNFGTQVFEPTQNVISGFYQPAGTKVSDFIYDLLLAEGGIFKLNQNGYFEFWNDCHIQNAPTELVLSTSCDDDFGSMILDIEPANNDNLINQVCIKWGTSEYSDKSALYTNQVFVPANQSIRVKFELPNDAISINPLEPLQFLLPSDSYFVATENQNLTGQNGLGLVTAGLEFNSGNDNGAVVFTNNYNIGFWINYGLYGASIISTAEYTNCYDDCNSQNIYGVKQIEVDAKYISNAISAQKLANRILRSYSNPTIGNRFEVKIKGIPNLSVGTKVLLKTRFKSYPENCDGTPDCGKEVNICDCFIVIDISSNLASNVGFVQDLILEKCAEDVQEAIWCEFNWSDPNVFFCGQTCI